MEVYGARHYVRIHFKIQTSPQDLNMKHVKHFTSSVQSYIIKLSIRGHSLKKVILHLKTQEEAHVYMENNGRAERWNEKNPRHIMVQITHFCT